MIHIHENSNGKTTYSISSYQMWLPGMYDSIRAANYAFKFSNTTLEELQNNVNGLSINDEDRVITFEMLQARREWEKQ